MFPSRSPFNQFLAALCQAAVPGSVAQRPLRQARDHDTVTLDGLSHPFVREFAGFWFDACKTRGALPARSAFRPDAHGRLLPHLALWAYEPVEDRFWLRLAGERVLGHMNDRQVRGAAPRGLPLERVVPASLLPRVSAAFRRVVREPAILHNIGEVTTVGGGRVPVERLVVPFAEDGRTPADLMVLVVYRAGGVSPYSQQVASDETPMIWLSLACQGAPAIA